MMTGEGKVYAFLNQVFEIDGHAVAPAFLLPCVSGFQNLLDRAQQPISIVEHAAVKLAALSFINFSMLQSLQVKPDGSDRRLEFVRDRVDETIVLLVATNLAQQKNSVKHQAGTDGAEENHTQKNFDPLAPVEDDPAKTNGHRHARQANAQDKERDCSFAP